MTARSALTGASYTVQLVRWCSVCEINAPADHTCIDVDHPGTYRLVHDLKTAVAAGASAAAAEETTPNT